MRRLLTLRAWATLAGVLVHATRPSAQVLLGEPKEPSAYGKVVQGVYGLQKYWNPAKGSWDGGPWNPLRGTLDSGEIGWWHAANALEVLAHALQVIPPGLWPKGMHDELVDEVIPQIFKMQNVSGILNAHSYDDSAWVALAWLRAYEATGVVSYLERSKQFVTQIMDQAWDDKCGGGFYWVKKTDGGMHYKNAITNGLAIVLFVRMWQHSTGEDAARLLAMAYQTWHWYRQSGLIVRDSHGTRVADGLEDPPSCTSNFKEGWTYNQGVIIAAIGLLHNATPAEEEKRRIELVVTADEIADAAFKKYGGEYEGVLKEPCESTTSHPTSCNADQRQFKGIFARYLAQYLAMVGDASPRKDAFVKLLWKNAISVWLNDRWEVASFGLHWVGPAFQCSAITQTSALGVLLAVLRPPPKPAQTAA